MMRQLTLLSTLMIMNAQGMHLNTLQWDQPQTFENNLNELQPLNQSSLLLNAIKRNDFDAVCNELHKIGQPNRLNSSEIKKASSETIKKTKEALSRKGPHYAYIVLGSSLLGLGAIGEYLATTVDCDTSVFIAHYNALLFGAGIASYGCGFTNYLTKQRFKNAVAIKQLLIDHKVIDENSFENEQV